LSPFSAQATLSQTKASLPISARAAWLKDHNPKRDPEMAAKVQEMRDALAVEAAAAAAMMESATKVQASVRGRQARLVAKGVAADAEAARALEEEAKAAEEAMQAAIKVQASIRGRQARAKSRAYMPSRGPDAEPDVEAEAEVSAEELEAEARAADEAAAAAIKVQASIRGRQTRAQMKK
jgi:uncharacterized protein YajQ (UPF0234 family)